MKVIKDININMKLSFILIKKNKQIKSEVIIIGKLLILISQSVKKAK